MERYQRATQDNERKVPFSYIYKTSETIQINKKSLIQLFQKYFQNNATYNKKFKKVQNDAGVN